MPTSEKMKVPPIPPNCEQLSTGQGRVYLKMRASGEHQWQIDSDVQDYRLLIGVFAEVAWLKEAERLEAEMGGDSFDEVLWREARNHADDWRAWGAQASNPSADEEARMRTKGLKGIIRIARPSYGDGHEAIEISAVDELSGKEFFEAHIDLAEFTKCLTGSAAECVFELRATHLVGMKAEYKRESVTIPSFSCTLEQAKKACAKFEVEGWKADYEDARNHHRISSKGDKHCASVGFRRHVKAT